MYLLSTLVTGLNNRYTIIPAGMHIPSMSTMRRGSALFDTSLDGGGVEPPLSSEVEPLELIGGSSVSLLDQLVSPLSTYPTLPRESLQYSRVVSSGYIPMTVRVAFLDISATLSSRPIEV